MTKCIQSIMQGDSYFIPFRIKDKSTNDDINIDYVSRIEFQIGSLKKYYGQEDDDVLYNTVTHQFFFPISQQESLAFEGSQQVQIRLKQVNNVVIGKIFGEISIQFSNSEVIL